MERCEAAGPSDDAPLARSIEPPSHGALLGRQLPGVVSRHLGTLPPPGNHDFRQGRAGSSEILGGADSGRMSTDPAYGPCWIKADK
jgi:hypothetical protein